MNTYIAVLFAVYVVLCLLNRPRGLILTATTYFDFAKEDHWTTFCTGIDSILSHHDPATVAQIDHWLVVNEWSDTPRVDWAARMQARYPFIEFVQKTQDQKGQVRSLNMILERIRPYEFWIHWEESWYADRPFLDRALRIIRTTEIDQLQFTTTNGHVDWMAPPRTVCNADYCIVHQTQSRSLCKSAHDIEIEGIAENWPLYSLRPSINRTGIYARIGAFDDDPDLWPLRFEWDYAVRWMCAGGIKGILPDGPVTRASTHVSTYE